MKSKEQTFWTTFAFFALILLGGAGFYLKQSYAAFQEADSGFAREKRKVTDLEKEDIYPKEENLTQLQGDIEAFELEVNKLHDGLKAFQKPLEQISDQQFPIILREKIETFRQYAAQNNVQIPENFYNGMGRYSATLPPPKATAILNYQLQAIEYLLRIIVDNEATQIYALERELTAVEVGEDDPELSEKVVKYSLKTSFQTTYEGFQKFLNLVSNDKTFFFIVRVLRVDNEEKLGPRKDAGDREYEDGHDARVIFGDEKLQVTAVIDICRFPDN